MTMLQDSLTQINDFLWTYIIITVLIGCALFFTWRTRFVQFRLIKEMISLLLHPDKIEPNEIGRDELSESLPVDGKIKHISSFQAFVVALASRIGTGNLAGVATAISVGGPGFIRIFICFHRIHTCPTIQTKRRNIVLWRSGILYEIRTW